MWKSREGQSPPPNFWADFVANVNVLFPGAALDRSTLDELYRLVVDEWRNGTQVHLIVRQLCSCDGQSVVPSEGARRRLGRKRGIARAPEGAVAGQVFGVEELRDPAPLARLLARKAMIEARIRSEASKKASEKRQQTIEALRSQRADVIRALTAQQERSYWSRSELQSELREPQQAAQGLADSRRREEQLRVASAVSGKTGYLLNGEHVTLKELVDNNDFEPDEFAKIAGLSPGARLTFGGGAAPIFILERASEPPDPKPERKRPKKVQRKSKDEPVRASDPPQADPPPAQLDPLDDDIAEELVNEIARRS